MHEFDKMLQWVKEGGGSRSITIEIGKSGDDTYLSKWAYDYQLKEGQHFDRVDEINLEKVKEQREREIYKELKNKFEKGV